MSCQRLVCALLEQVAVRKARQAVIVSKPLDPGLGDLALGDVFMRGNPAAALAPAKGNIDDAPVGKRHRVRRMLRPRKPVLQIAQIAIEIGYGLLAGEHLLERHPLPDLVRRYTVRLEPPPTA